MITVTLNTLKLEKIMKNVTDYSFGFIEGIEKGKPLFLNNLGRSTLHVLYNYIDATARMNPTALHHVYEWYNTGSPKARLFDLDYSVNSYGVSLSSSFKQSKSVSHNSSIPFYNKARIMEHGSPVTITPKKKALMFTIDGQQIFTSNAVVVQNPGGQDVKGSFESVISEFMYGYFKQSFLKASGLHEYLSNPMQYKIKLPAGAAYGKAIGITTGHSWIANAGTVIE